MLIMHNQDGRNVAVSERRGSADFAAEFRLLAALEGGRNRPIHSGYRGACNLGLPDTFNDVLLLFSQPISPGGTGQVQVRLARPELQSRRLYSGLLFSMWEGSRKIGTGTITEIFNPDLQR
jgi:translation elongation factor EF-Tu-like GTPase